MVVRGGRLHYASGLASAEPGRTRAQSCSTGPRGLLVRPHANAVFGSRLAQFAHQDDSRANEPHKRTRQRCTLSTGRRQDRVAKRDIAKRDALGLNSGRCCSRPARAGCWTAKPTVWQRDAEHHSLMRLRRCQLTGFEIARRFSCFFFGRWLRRPRVSCHLGVFMYSSDVSGSWPSTCVPASGAPGSAPAPGGWNGEARVEPGSVASRLRQTHCLI